MRPIRYEAIVCIDFDDTIARTSFPHIIEPMPGVVQALTRMQERGWFIIVNTCRSSIHEHDAIQFMREVGIPYNMVNQNHDSLIEFFVYDCRKISADVYIDDKNLDVILAGGIDWNKISHQIDMIEGYAFRKSLLNQARKCKEQKNLKKSQTETSAELLLNQFVRSERFTKNRSSLL